MPKHPILVLCTMLLYYFGVLLLIGVLLSALGCNTTPPPVKHEVDAAKLDDKQMTTMTQWPNERIRITVGPAQPPAPAEPAKAPQVNLQIINVNGQWTVVPAPQPPTVLAPAAMSTSISGPSKSNKVTELVPVTGAKP